MCKGVKYDSKNCTRIYSVDSGEEENQEHLVVCDGREFERRGLRMSVRSEKMQWKKLQEKNKNNVATVI